MINLRDSYAKITWDLGSKHMGAEPWGKTDDTGRGIVVTIVQNNLIVIPTTETLRMHFLKPDGTDGCIEATLENGKFYIETMSQVFAIPGVVNAEFELDDGTEFIQSITFMITVFKSQQSSQIISSNDYSALQLALSKVSNLEGNYAPRLSSVESQFQQVIANATEDSEVINARGGEVNLNARLVKADVEVAKINTSDNLYARLGFPPPRIIKSMSNKVINGNFASGISDWQKSAATISVTDGVLTIKGDGTATYPQIMQANRVTYSNGKKIYIRAKVKVTNTQCYRLTYFVAGGGMATKFADFASYPENGKSYNLGKIITLSGGTTGMVSVYLAHYYLTSAASLNNEMKVENFIVLDLTEIFGAGNEPTSEQMDIFLNAYNEQGWFDGTQPVPLVGNNNGKVFTEVGTQLVFTDVNGIINPDLIPLQDPLNLFNSNTIGLALKETKEVVNQKIGEAFDNAFEVTQYEVNKQDLLPVSDPKWEYLTSTFSGWGGSIGVAKSFSTIAFKIRNRIANTLPLTSIRVVVTIFDKNGAVLIDRTLSNFNILPGEEKMIYFPLGTIIDNVNNDKLWACFQTNQFIDVWYGDTGINLNAPNYGKTIYTTGGGFAEARFTQDLYDITNTNQRKPVLFACDMMNTLSPSQEFVTHIPALPAPEAQPFYEPVRIILPKFYTCVVGDTFQLFYRGIIEAVNPYIYDIRIAYNGNSGINYPRYFQITPLLADVGVHVLTVTVQTNSGVILATATTQIIVKPVGASLPAPKNILCIGDSLTSSGIWVKEGARRMSGVGGNPEGKGLSNFNFIGTCKDLTVPNVKWEGYGGWTWASYLAKPSATTLDMWVYCTHDKTVEDQHSLWSDVNYNLWQLETIETTRLKFTRFSAHNGLMPTGSGTLVMDSNATHTSNIVYTSTVAGGGNPFWNETTSQVDFVDYCSRNGFTGIDYVYTLLTWNGQAPYRATAADNAALITSAKSLIDKIHLQYPNAKVRIIGLQLPSLNGGMGSNYGASGGSYSEVYGNIRTVFGINLAYQALANESKYSSFVEFINLSGQFDSENNMPETIVPVNVRSSKTEYRGTNGVHPATEGYYQIGDAFYRDLMKTCYE